MTHLEITDVTLRDGLQMESRVLSVDEKLSLWDALVDVGFSRIEVTSFVNPSRIPQFADSEAFCQRLYAKKNLPETMAFVPNEKGLSRLLTFSIPWAACFVSVSESFNKKNVNSSVEESLGAVKRIVHQARVSGRKTRVYISTVFGCPYEGQVTEASLLPVFSAVAKENPDEIALGDTIGVATPSQVRGVVGLMARLYPLERIALHLHNTYGLAVACAQAAYELGVRKFDGATGGIGGCPYAKGASGNVASEDLLYAFWREGKAREFPGSEFQSCLKVLQQLHLNPQGRLAEIWKKGGAWFRVKEAG